MAVLTRPTPLILLACAITTVHKLAEIRRNIVAKKIEEAERQKVKVVITLILSLMGNISITAGTVLNIYLRD